MTSWQRLSAFGLATWLAMIAGVGNAADSDPSVIRKDLKARGLAVQRATAESAAAGARFTLLRDIEYARYGDRVLKADVFLPTGEAKRPRPGVLVVHGGGWLKGSREKFHHLAAGLAVRGYVAVAISYRLGGEAKFPAAIHDCNAATRWLRSSAKRFHVDPMRIGAVGGSAGGHLVGLMAAAPHIKSLQGTGGNPDVSSHLQAAVVLAGPMQLTTGSVARKSREQPDESNANKWFGKTLDQAPELYRLAAPFTHFSAQTPPMMFLRGEYDAPAVNTASRARLAKHGVETAVGVYARGRHGCWNQYPWQGVMLEDIDAFLAQKLGKPSTGVALAWKSAWMQDPMVRVSRGESHIDLEVISGGVANRVLKLPRLNNPVKTVELINPEVRDPKRGAPRLAIVPKVSHWEIKLPTLALQNPPRIRIITVGRPWSGRLGRVVVPSPATSSRIVLPAHDANIVGKNLRYEPQPHKNTVGYWSRVEDWCWWQVYVERPGRYEVGVLQGCGKGHGGSRVAIKLAGQSVGFDVEDTGGFQAFRRRTVGTVTIAQAGLYRFEVRPVSKKSIAVMDIREATLTRVGETAAK